MKGRIIIVDDEPNILEVLREMLTAMGYVVSSFVGSLDALDAFRRESRDIDLVVLDIQMPQMNGKALLHQMKMIRPDVRSLISTGFDEEAVFNEPWPEAPDGYIQKPYRRAVLEKKIQEIMSGGRPAD